MVRASYLPAALSQRDHRQSPPPGKANGNRGGGVDVDQDLEPSEGARNLGTWLGYRRMVDGLRCFCLMRGKQAGNLWVMFLKDHFEEYPALVDFWGGILARLAERHGVAFDMVTCPPSSGKRRAYLAGALAQTVARQLGAPYEVCFSNPDPRGHRASMQEKLREADGPQAARYLYEKEPDGEAVLVVDDAMVTRRTALRCVDAAQEAARQSGAEPDSLYFVVIYS